VHPNNRHEWLKLEKGGEFILPYGELVDLAKRTGFIERLRAVHPAIFVLTLLTYRSIHSVPTIRELWQRYVEMTGFDGYDPSEVIRYQSFYNHFNGSLVDFLNSLVISMMARLENSSSLKLEGNMDVFNSVYILDNTVIRLHDKLADLYPAARTRKPGKSAGFKLSLLFNAIAHGPSSISIVPERTHDIKTLRIGKWLKDCLIILDLGFYKHWNFQKIHEYGGSFLVRLKSNAKPTVRRIILPETPERYEDLIGLSVRDALDRLPRSQVVMEVDVSFRRKKYRNKIGRIDSTTFYCVCKFNHESGKWHSYLTNLSPDIFNVDEICALYAYRWTIEMLFKEMKSDNELGQKKSVNEFLSKALIYVSILRTIMSRAFYLLIKMHNEWLKNHEISPLRWSKIFCEHLNEMGSIIRSEMISGRWLFDRWIHLLSTIGGNAIPIKRANSRLVNFTSK
jgi:putative transposase